MNIEKKLLLGRFLTRSGDQAWDFVVPFALLHVFPGRLQIAALYYLLMKVGTLALTALIGKWMDSQSRSKVVGVGVGTQFVGVLGGILCFFFLDQTVHLGQGLFEFYTGILFAILCAFGVLASLGSVITDIAVGNDLAPSLVASERLTNFNSWLRRIDLGTEMGAPLVAGVIYSLQVPGIHLFGLIFVAVWNLVSFVPEYALLRSVVAVSPQKKINISSKSSWKDLFKIDFKQMVRNPIFLLMLSYAFLWLSVLSPHGVLLAGYLKDEMALPEGEIGLFRGLGAIFGLLSTFTFPYLVKKLGLLRSAKAHLFFQAVVLTIGIVAFGSSGSGSIYIFLAMILLSRVGLYGFSNGEFELRQRLIPEDQRGEVNSLSYLLTTFATLILFGLGSLLPQTADFKYLVYVSLGAVFGASFVFAKWARRNEQGG